MTNKSRSKTLNIDGTRYKTNFTSKFENRKKWKYPDVNKVTAFIPGTIVKVYANKGDDLKIGDKLLVLEAMKMKNIVIAPVPGKVKKINVSEGQVVPKDYLLVELE